MSTETATSTTFVPGGLCFSATDFNSYGTVDIADGAPKRVNGTMKASDAPGLGVTPKFEVLGAATSIGG